MTRVPDRFDVAVVGDRFDLSEPGAGPLVDAAARVLRLAPVPPDQQPRLGGARGEALAPEALAETLRSLLAAGTRAWLCGFDPTPVADLVREGAATGAFQLSGGLHRSLALALPGFGLPADYAVNPVAYFDDTSNTDEWQREVYALARQLALDRGWTRVLDIGCGSGYKLVHGFPAPQFRTIGVDLPPTVEFLRKTYADRTWLAVDIEREDMLRFRADLVIVSDIIEHLADPDVLLDFLAGCEVQAIVLSTPETDTLIERGERRPSGPPDNPCHVREWDLAQFARYVGSKLEVLHQELFPPNATQVVVARPPGGRAVSASAAPRAPVVEPPASVSATLWCPPRPEPAAKGTRDLWVEAGPGGRSAALRAALAGCGRDPVVVVLDPALDASVAEALCAAAARQDGLALAAPGDGVHADWDPNDGLAAVAGPAAELLRALEGSCGPHAVEQALLRLALETPKCVVAAAPAHSSPAATLAWFDAVSADAAAPWPDPRLLAGPRMRAALDRAREGGDVHLADDLCGLWRARTGEALAGSAQAFPVEIPPEPFPPELHTPLAPGSPVAIVAPDDPDAATLLCQWARRPLSTPELALACPLEAGLEAEAFASWVVAVLESDGLDPARIAPLVVLERPLLAGERAWLAKHHPAR